MFGLPLWAWELAIAFLRAIGAVNLAEALSFRLFLFLRDKVENLKTYHEPSDFPQGKNQQKETNLHSISNITPKG